MLRKRALQELQKQLEAIIDDGKVSLIEFSELSEWIEKHRDLQGIYPFDRVFSALDTVLNDGTVTADELEELQILFSEFTDPVKSSCNCDSPISLNGKHICVTGEFDYGSRETIISIIKEKNGIIDENVKKTTNYLIVGAKGSDHWKTNKYGGKIQKAMEYRGKGANIQIIEERVFVSCIESNNESENDMIFEEAIETDLNNSNCSWIKTINDMLRGYIEKEDLPNNSVYLKENYARDNISISSYSIVLFEPELLTQIETDKDPSRTTTILNMKEKKDQFELIIEKKQFDTVGCPKEAVLSSQNSDGKSVRVLLPKDSELLANYIEANVDYALKNYTPKAQPFGCCSRFVECSDVGKCIQPNKLYSKACMYRANLDAGKIFYGKNKNC